MSSEGHSAYFQHLEAYEGDLEGWRYRVQKLERPEARSQLDGDNAAFPYHPISDVVRLCLASAGEHLRLAWTAIKAGELYPTAHFSTLRGALVAASQAVYILGPEDTSLRRARGLAVIVESYKRLRQFHLEHLKIDALTDYEKQQIKDQVQWLNGRIQGAVDAGADKAGVNVSDKVIPYAAELTYQSNVGLQHSVNLLWRQMSGDAHALAWALTLRATLDGPKDGALLTTGMAGGSLKDISEPFEASFRILRRGWSLFDQRCEAC
ncbi:hypothetical protein [Arthrobacter sp. Leaf137]|uniref:hypothetical protein n=1 Tax=Arthrobacter sp. Leaf137 TaxID=1736271 RepID=UPI000A66DD7D|nr:hypothetical protein [Arthrobacter sp. Leaf137]